VTYTVEYTSAARRMLRKLPLDVQGAVHLAIEALGNDPRPPASRKLVGSDFWRLRVGVYRVVYAIEDVRLLVLVVKLGHRKDVYR